MGKQKNKGNGFHEKRLLRGEKLFDFRLMLLFAQYFFVKENKQAQNCRDNPIYYTTHVTKVTRIFYLNLGKIQDFQSKT